MSNAPKYHRKSLRLTDHLVARAVELSQDDGLGSNVVEWRDVGTVGLTLRITRNKPIWYLRRRETTIRMCDVRDIRLDEARYIAKHVQLAASRGRNLRDVVSVLLSYSDLPIAGEVSGTTRFDRDVEAILDHGIAKREHAKNRPVPDGAVLDLEKR
ncbi:hypothetical protein IVB30_40965 [Bradyrhizobium sp. 200]|uniref:hypothetical protein n=1 Tax=Bradyrhizobium sp. 200 TaxID=2782665 RepID=UPI0020001DC0|nr:hypothetical protein [Bradyrhizobium sp. 200]UPJ49255.1 hypothetical protein IVB30_40965 [Bradyrhizobium sp. 200]